MRAKLDVLEALHAFHGIDLIDLTHEDVEAYLDRELQPWTRRKYLEHLQCFARWAGIEDPTEGFRKPPQPRGIPRPVSEDDLRLIMAVAVPRTHAFIVLGAFAGLRAFEIGKVRGDDLQVTGSGPALRVAGKGGRVDVIPAHPLVATAVSAWRREQGDGRLWGATSGAVQQAIQVACRRADVTMTCHQLRHRFGTQLYAATRDLLLVQKLMRHASPKDTAGYALVDDRDGAAAVLQLPAA